MDTRAFAVRAATLAALIAVAACQDATGVTRRTPESTAAAPVKAITAAGSPAVYRYTGNPFHGFVGRRPTWN